MTGEDIAFAAEHILQAGALDVFTESIYMKKGRPAVKLTVLADRRTRNGSPERFFAIRARSVCGYIRTDAMSLRGAANSEKTPLGTIEVKISEGCGVRKEKNRVCILETNRGDER